MPPPWSAGAELRVVGEMHGQLTVNVWHMATNTVINDPPTNLDTILQALVDAMFDCVVEFLLPAVTSDWKLVHVDARRIAPVTSDPFVRTGDGSQVGELSATSHSFACALVHIRTGVGGKSGRGKKFLPPPGEAETVQSTVDAPTLALIAAFLACVGSKFMGANPTSGWTLGVLSKKLLANNVANFDNAFRVATSLNPVANTAIMSSRRKGRGA